MTILPIRTRLADRICAGIDAMPDQVLAIWLRLAGNLLRAGLTLYVLHVATGISLNPVDHVRELMAMLDRR